MPPPEGQRGNAGADYAQLTKVSQAPYRYRRMTYWTLANGCTYSPGIVYGGGLRWFLVKDPMSPERAMVHDGCAYMFEAAR
ncbi:hypothetical protein HCZ87_11925 [Phaeobacter sp. HF9A]|nr:hypothetical protein [Phaeobacter sp. HF9A]